MEIKILLKILGWMWSKMGVTTLVTELQNWLYLKQESMEQIAFLHTDTNSGTLKVTLIVIGCRWSNIGMTLGLGTVKSAVSQE